MRRQIQILILLCITISSCKQNTPKDLTLLTNEWTADSSTFWKVNNESDIELLKPHDTLSINFITRKVFKRKITDNLELEKIILIDSKSGRTLSESDLYKRKLGAFTESHVDISYDYEKEEYSAYIIDSTGTEEKIRQNQQEAENAQKYAKENNLYLCGTAYFGILNKNIPEFPIMNEITKDSALSIIKTWTNN